jgi:NAD(P)-dependent dehydrogenase (short-subunit alcohol dehydrogenase family)
MLINNILTNFLLGLGFIIFIIVALHLLTEIFVRIRSSFSSKPSLCISIEKLTQKTGVPKVLITGGLTGIGLELVLKFTRLGYDIEVWNLLRNHDNNNVSLLEKEFHQRVEKEQQQQQQRNNKISLRHVDVSDRKQVRDACKKYYFEQNESNPPDILILNAGVVARKALGEFDEGEVEKCFATNVTVHAFETLGYFLPKMVSSNSSKRVIDWRRSIILMSSVTSFSGFAYASEYCASKAALLSLGDSARAEIHTRFPSAEVDVDVMTVCPYLIATKMFSWCIHKTPSWFYGALDPKWVVDKIVDEGIRLRRTCLILPWFFNLMPIVKWVAPHWCWEIADKIMDASNWLKP